MNSSELIQFFLMLQHESNADCNLFLYQMCLKIYKIVGMLLKNWKKILTMIDVTTVMMCMHFLFKLSGDGSKQTVIIMKLLKCYFNEIHKTRLSHNALAPKAFPSRPAAAAAGNISRKCAHSGFSFLIFSGQGHNFCPVGEEKNPNKEKKTRKKLLRMGRDQNDSAFPFSRTL